MGNLIICYLGNCTCDEHIFTRVYELERRKCDCSVYICICISIKQDHSQRKNNFKKDCGKYINNYWNTDFHLCVRGKVNGRKYV